MFIHFETFEGVDIHEKCLFGKLDFQQIVTNKC